MDLSNLEDLRTALKLAGIQPRHDLGQNFLVDADSLNLIIQAAGLSAEDTVLEIGPGLGSLTVKLAEKVKKVIAVESDPKLAQLLGRYASSNTEIIQSDILQFDFRQLPKNYKVVSNIPYYLTSKIIRLLVENPNPPQTIVLLIQKEVAQRVCALPGDLSVLGLSVQYYGQPEIIGYVEREKFWPSPEVNSAILKISVSGPVFEADPQKLFRLVKAGFGEKRKMLKNSLAGGLNASDELISTMLSDAGISPDRRAQELSLKDWEKLYNVVVKHKLL